MLRDRQRLHYIKVDSVEGGSEHWRKLFGEPLLQISQKSHSSCNLVGADLLNFAGPEYAEVVSGRKNFKTSHAGKSVGSQTLRKHLGNDSKKRNAPKEESHRRTA